MVGLVCSPAIAGSSSDGCPLFGKLERRLYQQTGDGSPNTMASSSIDSLVENDGRVDTLPLFNRIAPNALFARIPSGPQPYRENSPRSLIGRSQRRGTVDIFQKPWTLTATSKTAQLAKIDTPPS